MIYFCCDDQRRNVVRGQTVFNGIDFLEVIDNPVDPLELRQRVLHLHFIHALVPGSLSIKNIRIEGGERIRGIGVVQVQTGGTAPSSPLSSPIFSPPSGLSPKVLEVTVTEAGDFSTYTLRLVEDPNHDHPPAGFDPVLSAVDFSFKVNCPSEFDCKPVNACPEEPLKPVEIDYLAKDYASFRQLMFDRMAQTIPGWTERNPADLGVALVELLAYAGDYLSYQQDAVATEGYIGTARRRTSVRRHARLVDYFMHDGANARAWVQVRAATGVNGTLLKQSHDDRPTQFLTHSSSDQSFLRLGLEEYSRAIESRPEFFELMHDLQLFTAHNEMLFYTWDAQECCLPKGATRATLTGHFPDLKSGDVVILAEVRGPDTGEPEDADPGHRHAVRLTDVRLSHDPLHAAPLTSPLASPPSSGIPITEITWHAGDALPFQLCVSARGPTSFHDKVSVVWGNIALVDHGLTVEDVPEDTTRNPYAVPSSLKPDYVQRPNPALVVSETIAAEDCAPADSGTHCTEHRSTLTPPRYRPHLLRAPLTQAGAYDPKGSARTAMLPVKSKVRPVIILKSFPQSNAKTFDDLTVTRTWRPVRDLLASRAIDEHFVVEVETDGSAYLRFGNGHSGSRPDPGSRFLARYRIGNGARGNIGAGSIWHLATGDPAISDQVVESVNNPMVAQGGVEPETIEQARRSSPSAFKVQERAVTANDYAGAALRCNLEIQRAAATFRWTGSWRTVFVTADRLGGRLVESEFETNLRRCLERFRMAGHDLEVDGPRFVSLEIAMTICVKPNYFASDVKAALLDVFSSRTLSNGKKGVFHPDNFTFGQPVFHSRLYSAAQAVDGVDSVVITKFQRQGIDSAVALDNGKLELARLEIARLDNDPDFPERGVIKFAMKGGR